MRSMQEAFSGFLKYVGLLIVLINLQQEQKILTDESSTPALKSPENRI